MATTNGVVYFDGNKPVAADAGSTGQVMTSNGASTPPAMATFPYNPGYVNKLSLTWVSNSQVSIGVGNGASSDNTSTIINGGSVTLSLASSGAGGLDTGSEAANTWYGVHVIYDTNLVNTTSGVFSLNGGIGSVPAVMPSGYNKSRFLGWVRNNGSSNLWEFVQTGITNQRRYAYQVDINSLFVVSAGHATTQTTLACNAFASPSANLILFSFALQGATAGNFTRLYLTGKSVTNIYMSPSSTAGFLRGEIHANCDSSQQVDYNVQNASDTFYLAVCDYFEDI